MPTSIEFAWSKVVNGVYVGSSQTAEPGKGLWLASFKVPFTDGQGTMEYFAIDGVVFLPRFCLNGQQRDAARKNALLTFKSP